MSYGHWRAITIDKTKVPNTDLTDFPVAIAGTLADFKTVANAGLVQHASGYDIAFYSDSGLTTQLKHEVVSWNGTTGVFVYFVKVPTLSHTVDTVIYVAYGNAAVTTDQSDTANTWNSAFKAVYHLGDGTTLVLTDSTGNANTLTNVAAATAAAGPFGGAATFNGTTQYLWRSANAAVAVYPITLSALFKMATAADVAIAGMCGQSASPIGVELTSRATANVRATQNAVNAQSTGTFATGAWHHSTARFISATDRRIHLDGSASDQNVTSHAIDTPDDIYIGARAVNSTHNSFLNGSVGEVRISNVDRGADWSTTEYNSLVGIASFYTLGADLASAGAPKFLPEALGVSSLAGAH